MAAVADDKEEKDTLENVFNDFSDMDVETPNRRNTCSKCKRPVTVCYCPFLPDPPLEILSTLYILQHPHEEKRSLRTVPMLCHGLQSGTCHILKGKRFNLERNAQLKAIYEAENTVLLYPGPDSQDVEEFVKETGFGAFNILLLDGTWAQARGIYLQNQCLQKLKKVSLKNTGISDYVIRTQPTECSLSTLESAASALSVLEGNPEIKEVLTKPLKALCQFQLDHGAVKHHSKQYLVENGLYVKQGSNGHCRQKQIQELAKEKELKYEPGNETE